MLWLFLLTAALIVGGFIFAKFTDQITCSADGQKWNFKDAKFGLLFYAAHLFVCLQCLAFLRMSLIKSTKDQPCCTIVKRLLFGDLA